MEWMRRTRLRRGSPAPITARQRDLLISTVTLFACCRSAPSFHSTWNFTRETIRRCERNFSHRSSTVLPSEIVMVFTAVSVAMPASQLVWVSYSAGVQQQQKIRYLSG